MSRLPDAEIENEIRELLKTFDNSLKSYLLKSRNNPKLNSLPIQDTTLSTIVMSAVLTFFAEMIVLNCHDENIEHRALMLGQQLPDVCREILRSNTAKATGATIN